MDYEFYEKKHFDRTESDDSIIKKQTGYGGFVLEKKLWKGLSIVVSSEDLNRPLLYIKKSGKEDSYNIVLLTEEAMFELLDLYRYSRQTMTSM